MRLFEIKLIFTFINVVSLIHLMGGILLFITSVWHSLSMASVVSEFSYFDAIIGTIATLVVISAIAGLWILTVSASREVEVIFTILNFILFILQIVVFALFFLSDIHTYKHNTILIVTYSTSIFSSGIYSLLYFFKCSYVSIKYIELIV